MQPGVLKKIVFCEISRFYNCSYNLGFQPLGKDLTNLHLRSLLHGIITISQFLKKTTAGVIFRKICILQNFAFYNFSEKFCFQSQEECWEILRLLLISRSIITVSKLHKKLAFRAIFEKFITCEILHFTTFMRILVSSLT